MKLRLKIADNTNHLPGLCLRDYWINHDERFFPYSLGEQKQNVKRIIKKYCNNKSKVVEIASVFPSVLEAKKTLKSALTLFFYMHKLQKMSI